MLNYKTYVVKMIYEPIKIDSDPNKAVWSTIQFVEINESNNWEMSYCPLTKVKMCYDENNLYLLYHVKDKYVISTETKTNGEVWKDSCVEIFISPFESTAVPYFNLEINAGGTALMSLQRTPRVDIGYLSINEINQIKIAHSLPTVITNEIISDTEWSIEAAIPFSLFEKYYGFENVQRDKKWRVNFYKCAENNSHPHWLSWNPIENPHPDFHKPDYFGIIEFSNEQKLKS